MNNIEMSLSERIAEFTLTLSLYDIPEEVIEHGKLLLLDTFGVAMSCQELEHAKAIKVALQKIPSLPQCTLWGTGGKAQLADAVLYNASLIHGMDYDDTHVGAIVHPSAPVVSTAITVGELCGASGEQRLEAIIAGWEVMVRLGLAAKGRFHDKGFHGTGIAAPFAAACTAARLLGMSKETLVNALGICGSQSAAIQEFLHDGTWVKKIHPGWGAHSAIYALLMSDNGFKGPLKVFEGGFGLWMSHLDGTDGLEEHFADLGSVWHTKEITLKMYPVCHMTHSFIDCILSLQSEHGFAADETAKIECRIEPRYYHIVCEPREAKVRPRTDYMMRFSLPYVAAVAAAFQRVSPWEIDLKYAIDPEIQALMDKVICIADDSKANPGHFPGWVEITTNDNKKYFKQMPYEKGSAQYPIDIGSVVVKFENNLRPFYSQERQDEIRGQINRFESMKNAGSFIDLLKADKPLTSVL